MASLPPVLQPRQCQSFFLVLIGEPIGPAANDARASPFGCAHPLEAGAEASAVATRSASRARAMRSAAIMGPPSTQT